MSLIEQALRRIQDPLIPAQQEAPPAKASRKADPHQAHSWTAAPSEASAGSAAPETTNSLVIVALAVLVLTGILVIGGAFWMGHVLGGRQPALDVHVSVPGFASQPPEIAARNPANPDASKPAAQPPKPSAQTQAPQPALLSEAMKLLPASNPPNNDLVLNGVVEGVGDSYAVINGTIVVAR